MTVEQRLADRASRCVSCGLCVPRCPTWQVSRNEANSPRGRIMIMAALAKRGEDGKVADADHWLDACLGCGECEKVCPSNVPYLEMLHDAKSLAKKKHSLPIRWLQEQAKKDGAADRLNRLLELGRFASASGIARLMPARIRALLRTIPAAVGEERKPSLPAQGQEHGSIALFTGCYGDALDANALASASLLLAAAGYKPHQPTRQVCCGAIAKHAGDQKGARALADANALAFADSEKVATTATGCAVELAAAIGEEKVVDAGELIASRIDRLRFKSADNARVLIHQPCSQRNKGQNGWVEKLLGKIPGLEIDLLPAVSACCGAGGISHLNWPETSSKIAWMLMSPMQEKLANGAMLVSTNHICGWHLAAAAAEHDLEVEHIHPLALAARYLNKTD